MVDSEEGIMTLLRKALSAVKTAAAANGWESAEAIAVKKFCNGSGAKGRMF